MSDALPPGRPAGPVGPDAAPGPTGAAVPPVGPALLPPLAVLQDAARVVSVPMRVRFRATENREVLLLRGPAGWGEFGPFPEYDDAEAAAWLAAGIEAAWTGYPAPLRDRVAVNATVPAVAADRVPDVLAGFGHVGTVKIKVAERGQGLEDDVARVAAVRRALPEAALRVDANAGWTHAAAVEALTALGPVGLQYAEQPVAGIDGLARLREALRSRGVGTPIAADESVRRADDPLRVARAGAGDLIVVKAAPLGGVRRALAVVAAAGLPAVVSSALDTSVGIRGGVALAAALPDLPFACGLGTVALMADDVVTDPLRPVDGYLDVRDVEPDPERLEALAAGPERERWWRDRLTRVHAVLAARG
ncbi:o-succinylbenzoate synthase [Tersicoccus solisilvae]|uniref:o-succinylbenzoate synthase n=1 Tax=Tersicoccus solisilvae TaxID=1882339 RepID=A0ABQ1P0W5_9MICC|nr:o-succinylbenzoate synthase [Tersicoccus solisilvae]GGC86841.1 o-succinylbenzoate synthase [Tersicoccus solisilvae]